jgi:hypothetical protein
MASFHNTNAKNERKPFCKVCQDAGKTESEYTSHYVRTIPDHNGNTTVICPTLISTVCRYCSKLGHTTKFCPVIKKNEERIQSKPVLEKKVIVVKLPKLIYNFALLAEDSGSGSDAENIGKPIQKARPVPIKKVVPVPTLLVPIKKNEDYPVLPNSIFYSEKKIMTGWAEAVAKTAVKLEENYIHNSIKQHIPKIKKAPLVVVSQVKKNRSWADDTDTEESDQEDCEV